MFTSFEMKEFFHDDNIDGILKSDPEISNVNSPMIEDGKESDVGTQQVAAGKHSYHELEVEEVEELKSDFPSCGKCLVLSFTISINYDPKSYIIVCYNYTSIGGVHC